MKAHQRRSPRPPAPAAPAQLILTIMPDGRLLVSARSADGAVSPPRTIAIDQDHRLVAFVADAQAFARGQLARSKPRPSGARETATQRSPTQLTANRSGRGVIMLKRMQHRRVTQIAGGARL